MVRTNIEKTEANEMVKNLMGWTLDDIIKAMTFDMSNNLPKQFHSCNAKTYDRTFLSYNIPVAIKIGFIVIELGNYSKTTSQQITRWAKECGCDEIYNIGYKFKELNYRREVK